MSTASVTAIKTKILLNETEKVKKFVKKLESQPFDADLSSGRYIVDGKSLLGIFSLNLSVPIELTIHADPQTCDEFLNWLGTEDMLVK